MWTKFVLVVIITFYIILLIAKFSNKGSNAISGGIQALQGVLWTFIAVNEWADSANSNRIAYAAIILLSFAAAARFFLRREKQSGEKR